MSASNDLGQWYKSIPKITRAWFTGSIIIPLAARLGLVRPQNLVLFVSPIIKHFQVCFIFHISIFYKFNNIFIRSGDYLQLYFSILWVLIIS